MTRAHEVLDFWFGDVPTRVLKRPRRLIRRLPYWGGNWGKRILDVDAILRDRFGDDLERAARGHYDDWSESPEGRLALIILLDQFARNIHRGTAASFANDARSLELALQSLDQGDDQQFYPLARSFFYLPLMHQENLQMQDRTVDLYAAACREARGIQRLVLLAEWFGAVRHRQIIRRFGRFPHRNVALGRESTPAERKFLRQPFSSF